MLIFYDPICRWNFVGNFSSFFHFPCHCLLIWWAFFNVFGFVIADRSNMVLIWNLSLLSKRMSACRTSDLIKWNNALSCECWWVKRASNRNESRIAKSKCHIFLLWWEFCSNFFRLQFFSARTVESDMLSMFFLSRIIFAMPTQTPNAAEWAFYLHSSFVLDGLSRCSNGISTERCHKFVGNGKRNNYLSFVSLFITTHHMEFHLHFYCI